MFHRVAIAASLLAAAANMSSSPTSPATGCLATGDGYLRARLRGALDLDLDWKNADMQCEGGPRPVGDDDKSHGVRVVIAGPARGDGRRIRFVFGVGGVTAGAPGEMLRTNVTLLFEGEKRIFATRGDDKCSVDKLEQQRVETLGKDRAVYRVVARGFCLGPATSLSRGERVFITSFDFAGRVEFEDDSRPNEDAQPKPATP